MGEDQFTVRWTGQLQPEFNETDTFYTRSDDGVRLFVDNKLILDNASSQEPKMGTEIARKWLTFKRLQHRVDNRRVV